MNSRMPAISVALFVLAAAASTWTPPTVMASTTKASRDRVVQKSFRAKDKEISDLKHRVALLEANIRSLNGKIDQLEAAPAVEAGHSDAKSSIAAEPLVVSTISAQRYDGVNFLDDTMWMFRMTLTNNTSIAVEGPIIAAKFSDGTVERLLPYGGSTGDNIVVGSQPIVKPGNTLTMRYFYSSHTMGLRTPVSAFLTLGASQLTAPVVATAPTLVSSP